MSGKNILSEYLDDPDFFKMAKDAIEQELSNLKKVVDKMNQMRVETAYLESDLMVIIDAKNWKNISELIGLAPIKIDVSTKRE